MAAKKSADSEPKKELTLAQAKKEIKSLEDKVSKYEKKIAKLENSAYCPICGTHKAFDQFYLSSDPRMEGKINPVCKLCAKKIAQRQDKNGDLHEPTKESIKLALKYLNKPFIESLYNSSLQESQNQVTGKAKNNAWTSYIKNVAMQQYQGMTYFDSDMYQKPHEFLKYEDEKTVEDVVKGKEDQDVYADFLKNKKDVIRLLSYDPFDKEAISDQPFLYSQLLGLLDSSEDANDDMMRTASAISIVRGFLQQSKIDDAIATIMMDIGKLQDNSATIKSLQDSKSKITGVIKDLAAESCISLKNNKNAKKGENTWTGKTRKLKELALREAEVNGFDIATCRGMRQVQEMSDASIMKQLALDESEWSDMVAEMREINQTLRRERDSYQEINRILLRENIDLKDYMEDKKIKYDGNVCDLRSLYSVFSSIDNGDDDDE